MLQDAQHIIVTALKGLEIELKTLGPDHPRTATTYNNMALVYNNQGEYEKALEWYEKGLEIDLKTLGPDHPSTASTYFNLGALYYNMKDYKTSLENLELALAIYLKSFGPNHPHISSVKSWISHVKEKM